MKIRIYHAFFGIGLIALMTFLFIKTNAIGSESHNQYSQRLRRLKELDATLNKDILESRYGLLTAYDQLAAVTNDIGRIETELNLVPDFISPKGRDEIELHFAEFKEIQDKKNGLIERFKSRNAIINNSLRYFPVATSKVVKNTLAHETAGKETEQFNSLLRDLLTYYLLTDSGLEATLAGQITRLEQRHKDLPTGDDEKTSVDITLSHARTILKLKPEIDALVQKIISEPTAVKTDEIIRTYDSYHDEALGRADRYRLILYVFSVLLVAYVAFIIFKLKKATSALNSSNESLEQHVQVRTEELTRSNVELQAIFEIIEGISSTSNLSELLHHIHLCVGKFIYAENCFVALYDETTEMLGLEFFVDKYDHMPAPFKLGKQLTAYIFREGHSRLLKKEDIEEMIAAGTVEMTGTLPATWLGVPLRTPRGVIGVLTVQHYEDGNAYGQRDLDLLTTVGDQIATAIERKRAEDALKASEVRFQNAFDYAPVGIALESLTGTWLQSNRSLCEMLGYTNNELKNRTFDDITHPDDVDVSRYARVRMLNGDAKTIQFEKKYIHKLGHTVLASVNLSPVRDDNGEPLYMIAQIQDITERKVLEEKLQRGQKLESIGQLAAGIAHEINTPTQYVGDNVRFLQDSFIDINSVLEKNAEMIELCKTQKLIPEFAAEMEKTIDRADLEYLTDEVPKAFKQALDGVDRIRKIVQSMKDFAHPGSTDKKATDLNKAIESTVTVASNEWKYVANIVTNYDEMLPAVPCLAGEFNQVILNMIVNASHAIAEMVGDGSQGKGTINITTRRNGEFAEIRISDSGSGIPENVRKKIFDPFFTTKEVGKGTGQGLAISHTVIVDKHKGTIDVESEIGKGTTFIINLPVSEIGTTV